MWLYGYVAMWLCGCTGGTAAQVTGEPPARATLTDLSSGLLEPQGKPGWGTMHNRKYNELTGSCNSSKNMKNVSTENTSITDYGHQCTD